MRGPDRRVIYPCPYNVIQMHNRVCSWVCDLTQTNSWTPCGWMTWADGDHACECPEAIAWAEEEAKRKEAQA